MSDSIPPRNAYILLSSGEGCWTTKRTEAGDEFMRITGMGRLEACDARAARWLEPVLDATGKKVGSKLKAV